MVIIFALWSKLSFSVFFSVIFGGVGCLWTGTALMSGLSGRVSSSSASIFLRDMNVSKGYEPWEGLSALHVD